MALLLLCLVVFGRVFAICCTSIWWYLLPVLSGEEALGLARPPATAAKPRKDVASIRAGDKLALAPPASRGGKRSSSAGAAHEMISPRSHAHRKKG
ncbi:ZCF37 [Zea mays]|nr:ZCF37 [Zea mays]